MNYTAVFDLIDEAAKKANVHLILIGGFAVNAYNYARNTRDIDFLVSEEDYRKLSIVLSASGYEESVRTQVFAKQVLKDAGAMPLDFLFVDSNTFELMWSSGRDTMLSGRKFRVPSLLHLIALKLHAIKQGSKDRSWKDIPDIVNLIIANEMDARSSDFIEICRRYGPEGIHQKILEMTQRGSRGRS